MKLAFPSIVLAAVATAAVPWLAATAAAPDEAMATVIAQDDVVWVDAPDVLPPGAKIAVLEGDPFGTGPFTLRARLPVNYRIPPHTHPTDERLTVLAGTLYLGLGETPDPVQATELRTGSYAVLPTGMAHYAFTRGVTYVQISGEAPFAFDYVDPVDDPRNR